MSIFLESARGKNKALTFLIMGGTAVILLAALFLTFSNWNEWELRYRNAKVVTRPYAEKVRLDKRLIKKTLQPEDTGRGAWRDSLEETLQSRLFQLPYFQDASTSGRSPDELSISFDTPVKIHGVLISVDIWKSTRLVEFAAGINQKPAYQVNDPDRDMLIHTSFATNTTAGITDEHIWFPKPYLMTPTDSLNIGAWIQNVSPKQQSVSPEFIIYFSWNDAR